MDLPNGSGALDAGHDPKRSMVYQRRIYSLVQHIELSLSMHFGYDQGLDSRGRECGFDVLLERCRARFVHTYGHLYLRRYI